MFFGLIHEHYWGIPHRRKDGCYMTCYECGKDYKLKICFDNQGNKLSESNIKAERSIDTEEIKKQLEIKLAI
jgi:hypothetical protein